ncbi:MAG TPA: hypothetical protein VGD59_02780, partial [Acidisarcina sp.]
MQWSCRCSIALAAFACVTTAVAATQTPPVLQTRPAESAPSARPENQTAQATPVAPSATSILDRGIPLRVELDHGYPSRIGTRVDGHLISPVYRMDHVVLPAGTQVSGIIQSTRPIAAGARFNAWLDGDFTPLATPQLTFDSIRLPNGTVLPLRTVVEERTAKVIQMTPAGKRSIVAQIRQQIQQRKQDALDIISAPGKGDRLRRYVYGQLPYHPQRIWRGTQYDAELLEPLVIPDKSVPMPLVPLGKKAPSGKIQARLTTALTSATTQKGAPVEAVLSRPLLDSTGGRVLLPEGTRISGSVLQVKPAAWFARNGRLRFNFRTLEPVPGAPREPEIQVGAGPSIEGHMTSAEATADQNLSIDSEGGAKAGPPKDQLLAPLLLGVLAISSLDRDRDN